MLTAANIRLESGCEDKYLSLHRQPPNPYLLGVGGWKRWSHFIKVKRTNICYYREQLCSKSILLRSKKENNNFCTSPYKKSIESLINMMTMLCWFCDRVTFLTSWCLFCDHVYSIELVTPGSPPAFVPGNASDPLLPRPPHPSPNIPHYFLLLVCSISSFSPHTRSDSQSSWVWLIVIISYCWDMYDLEKVRHEPDKCIITIWPQLYPQPKA